MSNKEIIRNVENEMKDSYLRYSMSVIISRALPDVRDGLKPSQRRILYAMKQLNLSPGSKHRKCAKICGDTSGDYHPHGELVIYPTLVRMAQEWVMRYPLVDGQGNFGSVDGDPPAAMRYTEAKMTKAAVELMEDLDKDTVDYVSNYDETKVEPKVFPSKFPNLLSNGSSGIAVGMATNIPPHNVVELINATILLIDDKNTAIDDILKVMPGPDFPSGGIICGRSGILDAYNTGRGKLTVRASLDVEDYDDKGDRSRIVIHEIPYGVNKSRLIESIAELINEKQIVGISDLRDESDKSGMRIVIELKRGIISDVVLNQLYKFTDMQVTFGCNMLALDKSIPRLMGVREMINCWVDHRIEVVRRRTKYELNRAENRAHILEGYLKAVKYLDDVVKIIRGSKNREEAKLKLIEKYLFSDRQANAVLDLRLYQLTGLEHDKIAEEYQQLLEKIKHLKAILADEKMVKDIIKNELRDIQKRHSSERKTKIESSVSEVNMEDLIADEEVIISLSNEDYIKRMPINTFKQQKRGGQGVVGTSLKNDESVKDIYIASTHDNLLIFTSFGKCYWLKVWQIPQASRNAKGRSIVNFIDKLLPNEKVASILCLKDLSVEGSLLHVTKSGIVKKTAISCFAKQRSSGVNAIKIIDNDELIKTILVDEESQIMLFTKSGMAVRFLSSDVRNTGRGAQGVKGVKLKNDNDSVVGCEVVKNEDVILVVSENGFGKRTRVKDFRQTKRGGVGVKAILTSKRNGNVITAIAVNDDDELLIMSSIAQTVRIPIGNVRIMGRSTQGVKLINLKDDTKVASVQKILATHIDEDE